MFRPDGGPTNLTSPSNQLVSGGPLSFYGWYIILHWNDKGILVILQADMDRFVEDGSLDDNVESFLSHDDTDLRDTVGGRCMDVSKGKIVF